MSCQLRHSRRLALGDEANDRGDCNSTSGQTPLLRYDLNEYNPNVDDFIPIVQNPHVPFHWRFLQVCRCTLIVIAIIVFCCATAYVCTTVIEQFTWETPGLFIRFNNENKLSTKSKSNVRKFIRNLDSKYDKLQRLIYSVVKTNQKLLFQVETLKDDFSKNTARQIEDALELYDADKLGKRDYALESAGGYIISTPNTIPYITSSVYSLMNIFTWKLSSNPRKLLEPGSLPGQCFAFYGNKGTIRIGLSSVVALTAITIEHTSSSLVDNLNSAPKDFDVYGLDDEKGVSKHLLGSFVYQTDKKPIQTFQILNSNNNGFRYIELDILTNHGNLHFTSIYRVRIHGITL